VGFFSATFGAGVIASQCPITRPKRRIQPERYAKYDLNFLENKLTILQKSIDNIF
jgi:hypothetical protein